MMLIMWLMIKNSDNKGFDAENKEKLSSFHHNPITKLSQEVPHIMKFDQKVWVL